MQEYVVLPPEINSGRMYAGAGSTPLFGAAAAWDGLAADLWASAASFESVTSGLAGGSWTGAASMLMAGAAAPYVGWLSAAAGQAELSAVQARVAGAAFEAAQAATVPPAAVVANRTQLAALVATNFLGQNTPAIAATEFLYVEMWAQDVAAMLAYEAGTAVVASALIPFSVPPVLLGMAAQGVGAAQVAGTSAVMLPVQAIGSVAPALVSTVSALPLSDASMLMYPASMMMYPLSMLMRFMGMGGMGGANGMANAAGAGLPGASKLVGGALPGMKGAGAVAGGLGRAHLVGAMSVPAGWAGSMPGRAASAAMAGLASTGMPAMALPAGMGAAGAGAGGGGMPMMPMPMGMGGQGGMMPGRGMMGGGTHVVTARPSVVPRTGVG